MKGIRTGRKTGRLPPRLVLWAMALSTVLFRVPERVRRAHFAENTRLWDTLAPAAVENGFIERQEMLAPLRYGVSRKGLSRRLLAGRPLTGGENTCEVIAVYNALGALNMPQPGLPELLRRFEGRGDLPGRLLRHLPVRPEALFSKTGLPHCGPVRKPGGPGRYGAAGRSRDGFYPYHAQHGGQPLRHGAHRLRDENGRRRNGAQRRRAGPDLS